MSDLNKRIITSHKEAAKRAIFHMGKTRKLRMASAEALELVAAVLGVVNWQTLLAMANEGRGPRIADDKAVSAGPAPELSIAERLANYYGTATSWGEHPLFTRKDWANECKDGNTGAAYWGHVEQQMEFAGEMLPWERDACFEVMQARLAFVGVESCKDEEDCWLITDPWGYIFAPDCSTEKGAWLEAASAIQRHVVQELRLSQAEWEIFSEAQWLEATSRVHGSEILPQKMAAIDDDELPSDELDNGYRLLAGEMTKDSRKFDHHVGVCHEAGLTMEYTDEREDEGLFWKSGRGEFFATEAEGWMAQSKGLQDPSK